MAHALGNLKGEPWRKMRSSLTPLYTGSKFRNVTIPALVQSKQRLIEHLLARTCDGSVVVDMLDVATRSVIDSFTQSSLGIETDVLENSKNEFMECADNAKRNLRTLSYATTLSIAKFPRLMKHFFGRTMLCQKAAKFFEQILMEVADVRERSQIHRLDVLDLVVNVKNPAALEEKDRRKLSSKVPRCHGRG